MLHVGVDQNRRGRDGIRIAPAQGDPVFGFDPTNLRNGHDKTVTPTHPGRNHTYASVHVKDLFVVVSGAPGAGKTSVAEPLARELGLPLFEKDTIKEALGDVLGANDLAESKRLGAATMEVLFASAGCQSRARLVESTWLPNIARAAARGLLGARRSRCSATFRLRSRCIVTGSERARVIRCTSTTSRPAASMAGSSEARRSSERDWPVIRVDTTKPVDIAAAASDAAALEVLAGSDALDGAAAFGALRLPW